MAEKAADHEQKMERDFYALSKKDQSDFRMERRIGQFCGLTIAVVCMIVALVTALYGHDWVAGLIGCTAVVGLVTVFVKGKSQVTQASAGESVNDRDAA